MKPSEIAYLILFSVAKSAETCLLDNIKHLEGTEFLDNRYSHDENHSEVDLTIGYENPAISVQIEGNYDFSYTKFYPATHVDPPEGGDFILESVEIENVTVWIDGEDIIITPKIILNDDVPFSYNDIKLLATEIVADMSPDTNGNIQYLKSKDIPFILKKRIEKIMHDNKKTISVKKLGRDFNI